MFCNESPEATTKYEKQPATVPGKIIPGSLI